MTLQQKQALAIAQAKAAAESQATQDAQVQATMEARGPQNVSGSPDDRQVASDEYRDNNYQSGIAAVPHNTMLEAKGIAKGVANAGIGALQTANAVGHSIGSGLGRAYDAVAPSIGLSPRDPESVKNASLAADREQKAFQDATFQETTGPDKIFMPAGQIGANIAVAGGVGKAVAGIAKPIVGRVGAYLAGGLAGGATAASSFPQQEGLLIRHDGYVGFDIKPDDDAATQQTKKFINQSLDNMALGVVGDGVFKGLKKTGEVVKNIYKSFADHGNMNALQQQAAEDVLSVYAQLGEHPTPEQQRKAAEEVSALIDKNGIETYDFGSGGKKQVKKDTISTLTSDLNPANPSDNAIETKLEALRASAKRGNAPKTQVQLQQPEQTLNQGLSDIQSTAGGTDAVDQTTTALQKEAQLRAANADVPVQAAKADIARQSSDYTDVLKKDPTFAPVIQKAETSGIPLDINQTQRDLKKDIVTKSNAAYDADKAIVDAKYKKVADLGAPADMDSFNKVVEDNADNLPSNIQKLVKNADGTYGYLYNQVRPQLSKEIGNATKAGKDPSALYALKRNIDQDQIDFLSGKGGPFGLPVEPGSADDIGNAVQTAAQDAKDQFIAHQAKWGDTIGAELKNNKNVNKFAPGRMQERGRDIVDSAISNPNRVESIQNLKTILGPDEGLVADTALAKATQDITAGKGANIDKITSDLQSMANSFGPKQKARLEGFLTDLKDKKMTIDDLKSQLPDLEAAAKQEKDDIFLKDFPNLFETVAGRKIPHDNGYKVFNDAMNAEQPRVIQALVDRANSTGQIDGLKSAWARSASEQINSSSKQVGKLSDQFLKSGETIFGKDAPEVTAVKALRDYSAKLEASLNKPGLEGFNAKQNQKNLRTALALVETWMFGVLNPTRARIDKITSQLAEKYDSTSTAHQAIDNILSDNQEMKKAMQALITKASKQLDPETWKKLYAGAARLGLYEIRPQTNLKFQTDQATGK